MIMDDKEKQILMEARDINYILPAYVRSYLFYSKNELPRKIVYPMFSSITVQGKQIPIEYVPPLDAIAVEIAKDGADVAEVTPEEEAMLDEKDEKIKMLKEELERLRSRESKLVESGAIAEETPPPAPKEVSPARAAFAEAPKEAGHDPEVKGLAEAEAKMGVRQPKQPPGGDVGPGLGLSDTHARDRRDQIRTAKDLMDEPDTNEAEEKEYEKPISRDEEGKPVVEDKNE